MINVCVSLLRVMVEKKNKKIQEDWGQGERGEVYSRL